MAWSTPMTAVAGAGFTAAQFNASVRDNLLETAVAKATSSGRYFAATGLNTLAERIPGMASIAGTETTTNGAYVNLATVGPDVIVVSGNRALMCITSGMSNNTVDAECYVSVACSNATTFVADDAYSLRLTSANVDAQAVMSWCWIWALTAGTNEFRMRYRVSSGTGSFFERRLSLLPF